MHSPSSPFLVRLTLLLGCLLLPAPHGDGVQAGPASLWAQTQEAVAEPTAATTPSVPQTFDWWLEAGIPTETPWGQLIDTLSTRLVRSWTTMAEYTNPLVDHLPFGAGVPSPTDHFGQPMGRPGELHRVDQLYAYYERLAAASPRVDFRLLGETEEGNRLAVLIVGSEENLARLDAIKEAMAALADPRATTAEQARELMSDLPVLYVAYAGLHSPETGPPEMVTELAYRLAVSDDPFLRPIRENVVTFIVPVAEPDGRNRVVEWHRRTGRETFDFDERAPGPPFWGTYIRHDNNRDGLQLTARLTQEILGLVEEWNFPVGHDLHESVPYLYVSTGTGPYNPNIDPITVSEWQWISNYEVTALTALGMPGVWTHGFYDGWWPGYLLWLTNNRNGVGRFYETFGNSVPNTMVRELGNPQTRTEWYRPNPPRSETLWSLRNNTNYMQTGILHALHLVGTNRERVLDQFWTKSVRAVERGRNEAPFVYHVPVDQPRRADVTYLLDLLRRHGIELHRAEARGSYGETEIRPGDVLIRMDQPYRNLVENLMSVQHFPEDAPRPYDDVAWTFPLLHNVTVSAVDEPEVRELAMALVDGPITLPGEVRSGSQSWFAVRNEASSHSIQARYALAEIDMWVLEETLEVGDETLPAGSWLVSADDLPRDRAEAWARDHGLTLAGIDQAALAEVRRAPMRLPRIALLHSWRNTQDDGWARYTLDRFGVPYTYFSEDRLREGDLRSRFDVILFPDQGRAASSSEIFQGLDPRWSPLPYTRTEEFPTHGYPSSTDDMTGGMGHDGLAELRRFVDQGGTFITLGSATTLAVDFGFARGISLATPRNLFVPGSLVRAETDGRHPLLYGYEEEVPILHRFGPYLSVPSSQSNRVRLRYAGSDRIFLSGLVQSPDELAEAPALVSLPVGEGYLVLFGFNPLHRFLTHGEFGLVWNALLNWDRLDQEEAEEAAITAD